MIGSKKLGHTSALAAVAVLGACGSLGVDQAAPTPPTRPAAKSTCPEATLTSEMEPIDRVLVPYSDTLLGVETVWGTEDKRIRLVSGGYLDDVLEAYDDLEESGRTELRDSEATLLRSSLMDVPVRVAVWREDVEAPCDTHALIAIGLSDEEFDRQLESVK